MSSGRCTWGAVEVLVVVVLSDHIHGSPVLLTGLLSSQQAHVVGVQHHEGEAGERAESVGVDPGSSPIPAQAARRLLGVSVEGGRVEPGAQQLRPAEVIELVVTPHMVHLHGAERPQHRVQRPVGGAAALVEAVDDVPELEDEPRRHGRVRPALLGVPQQLEAAPVVAPPRPGEVVAVVYVRVLDVSDHTEREQGRLLLIVHCPPCV